MDATWWESYLRSIRVSNIARLYTTQFIANAKHNTRSGVVMSCKLLVCLTAGIFANRWELGELAKVVVVVVGAVAQKTKVCRTSDA